MDIKTLLKDPIFQLPLSQPKNKTFDTFITDYLNSFLEKVNQLESINIEGFNASLDFVKDTQKRIVKGLIKTINEYYNGYPSKAFNELSLTLKNSAKDLYEVIKNHDYDANEDFYRIRLKDDNFAYSAEEMFHIPFEMRGKVATQRFSIPGFPSLYLGKTLYVCWEEYKRPQISNFQAVRLNNVRPIKVIDLSPPIINEESIMNYEIYKYLMTFPLIACCSVKVKNYSDVFKPEYIIPQLLLQWVREKDDIDGIQYKSTHLEPSLYNQKGDLMNIVLPVKHNNHKGHCKHLKSIFESTDVVSWQIYQYAIGGQFFGHDNTELKPIDDKLPKLEMIKGMKYPYSYSILGQLEHYLGYMQLKKLK